MVSSKTHWQVSLGEDPSWKRFPIEIRQEILWDHKANLNLTFQHKRYGSSCLQVLQFQHCHKNREHIPGRLSTSLPLFQQPHRNTDCDVFGISKCRNWTSTPLLLVPDSVGPFLLRWYDWIKLNELSNADVENLKHLQYPDGLQPEDLWTLDMLHPGTSSSAAKWLILFNQMLNLGDVSKSMKTTGTEHNAPYLRGNG